MTMKNIHTSRLVLTMFPGACSKYVPAENSSPSNVTTEASSTKTSTDRKAFLSEFEKKVTLRLSPNREAVPAAIEMIILPAGGVPTGHNGRARLDLQPEGTIVRLGPNSNFTISLITEEITQPKTTFELLVGKIYILLKGGSLNVQTHSGLACVRGSLLGLEYKPELKNFQPPALKDIVHWKMKTGNRWT
jgi:hypothetical protein